MKRILFYSLCIMICSSSALAEDLFSPEEKKNMMLLTLENFWGKAIDSKGKPVQPKDEKERKTVPISRQQAYYLITKGGESGLAQWCGVKWKERYLLMVKQLRENLSNDTQAAYAGVLHGVAQQTLAASLEGEPCDVKTKRQVRRIMIKDIRNLKQSLSAK